LKKEKKNECVNGVKMNAVTESNDYKEFLQSINDKRGDGGSKCQNVKSSFDKLT